jgi:hypothetical protein
MTTLLVGIQFSQLVPAGEMAQRSGLTPSETARDQIGMLRGECSECCARSFRNPVRHQVGTVRTIISESAIRRKIDGDAALEARLGPLLGLAQQVRSQDQHQRGPKVYALHAPEVECIGKGKARAPYEFGCKVSIATPVTSPKGGQFVLHAKALHGNPFDGHTLGPVIADMEKRGGSPYPRR